METSTPTRAMLERTRWILWVALLVSQGIYLIVPQYATGVNVTIAGRDASPGGPLFPIVLGGVAIAEAIGIWLLFQIRAVRPIREGRIDLDGQAGQAQLFQTLILAWVLAESIAIYGLVLHLLRQPWVAWVPFAVLGAFMLVLCRPGQASLQPPASTTELANRADPIA